MPFAYILKSLKDKNNYIGSTINLEERLKLHRAGRVGSTRCRLPLVLVGYREFSTIEEAACWEKKYKNSHGQLERDIKNGKITIVGV